MGFEINTRMKFSSVDEKFKSEYGVVLALGFEKSCSSFIEDRRFSELSTKTNGIVQVTDNMTVGEFRKQMSEQFGGSASIWVERHKYKGHDLSWYMAVADDVKICEARRAQSGKFVKTTGFCGIIDCKSEQEVQDELVREDLEEIETEALTFTIGIKELDEKIQDCVRQYELIDASPYIRDLKMKMVNAASIHVKQLKAKIFKSGIISEKDIAEVERCCAVDKSLNQKQILNELTDRTIINIRGNEQLSESIIDNIEICAKINPSIDKDSVLKELSEKLLIKIKNDIKWKDHLPEEIKSEVGLCCMVNQTLNHNEIMNELNLTIEKNKKLYLLLKILAGVIAGVLFFVL